ncbi:MAG: hypothetical protein U5Q16_16865 [Gammaproteobacteria bacterium]|nr:hypothetical protein [Gammaproteobacteria bacterium]
MLQMFEYAQGVYEDKLNEPGDDLASQIVHAEVDGKRLDQFDFQLFFLLLIDAGGDTTRNLVAGVELHFRDPTDAHPLHTGCTWRLTPCGTYGWRAAPQPLMLG